MKTKPRVLIDSFHLFQALTGIRTYTTKLFLGLEKAEFEDVEYLIYPNWNWVSRTTFLRGKVNIVKKIANHMLYFIWKQCCLPLLILVKRVDVIVVTDYLLPYFKFGARSIAVFHDTFYWELKGNYNPLWRSYFLKSVSLGLNTHTDLIATTHYIADKVMSHVTNRQPISVVYQAPKQLEYNKGGCDILLEDGLPKGANYLLHVGIFEKRKNLSVLISAFSRLTKEDDYKDFFLVLAGGRGVAWFHDDFNSISQLVKELGLEHKVIMPGFIPDRELGMLYQNAYAYVFPSREEGFGIPILEAMNSGTPVIISNQPALMEVAGEAALIFDMHNSESLYEQILSLRDKKLREGLIEKGKRQAVHFTEERFVKKFHDVVRKKLMANKS